MDKDPEELNLVPAPPTTSSHFNSKSSIATSGERQPPFISASNADHEAENDATSLLQEFSTLTLSTPSRPQMPSPRYNIPRARTRDSPLRLGLGRSEYTLTGTGTSPESLNGSPRINFRHHKGVQKKKFKRERERRDRSIPIRGFGTGNSPTGIFKIERPIKKNKRKGKERNEGNNSVLAGSIFKLGVSAEPSSEEELEKQGSPKEESPKEDPYRSALALALGLNKRRILRFKSTTPPKRHDLRALYNRPLKPFRPPRRIPGAPEKVLDAPGILDDFYINVLDWSAANKLAIALDRSIYIYDADTGVVILLLETPENTAVTSLKWVHNAHLAVGTGSGEIQLWDTEKSSLLRKLPGHSSRVGIMASNNHTLSSGSQYGQIFTHDIRGGESGINLFLDSHTEEVCGLDWRRDGVLLASGGNDNYLVIWDIRAMGRPRLRKPAHHAAVRALAWCPWDLGVLATGGGMDDPRIKFWNMGLGTVKSIDSGGQVTSLRWSTHYREIVSSHGYPHNQLIVWKYPSLEKRAEIMAHETRVLHTTLSPDGQTLATAAGDEELKFWKLFEKPSVPEGGFEIEKQRGSNSTKEPISR
ncbi:WD repeat-containing protein slp1 [Rhizina undulata]